MEADVYGVILAGGKGERLWPLSRQNFPKQLLSLSKKSLLEHTKDRFAAFIPKSNLMCVTLEEQAKIIAPFFNDDALICEPHARNTAAAILLSCLRIAAKNEHASILFSPADHYITDREKFVAVQQKAVAHSMQHDVITLIGVKPTHPATGYGYIEYTHLKDGIADIVRFHEKPSHVQACAYLQTDMVWNIGIFCAKVSVFISEYKRLAPQLYQRVYTYFISGNADLYKGVESISIDYALMEKSNKLSVIPADFGWSDIGNLETFLTLQAGGLQKPVEIHSSNNVVMAEKLTVLIGVHDLCVVQTDDVILIAKRDEVENVKSAVNELKKQKLEKYL